MRIIEREPHAIFNVHNKRFEFENDEWLFKATGTISHAIETYDEVFDRNGNPIREMLIDEEIITETKEFSRDLRKGIVQINHDFHLLPYGSPWTVDDFDHLFDILVNTFNYKFYIIHIDSIKYGGWFDKGKEICRLGYSRALCNSTPIISLKEYKSNYKKALIKFPEYKDAIERLFQLNSKLY
jgi:hypothetical protein